MCHSLSTLQTNLTPTLIRVVLHIPTGRHFNKPYSVRLLPDTFISSVL